MSNKYKLINAPFSAILNWHISLLCRAKCEKVYLQAIHPLSKLRDLPENNLC